MALRFSFAAALALLSQYAASATAPEIRWEAAIPAIIERNFDACSKALPQENCGKIFDYLAQSDLRAPQKPLFSSTRLFGLLASGSPYDWAHACHFIGATECSLLKLAVEPAGSEKRACASFKEPEARKACQQAIDYRAHSCKKITDPFLASRCLGMPSKSCANDLSCGVAWGIIFAGAAESLSELPAGFMNALTSYREEQKKKIIEIATALTNSKSEHSPEKDYLPAPDFPRPRKPREKGLASAGNTLAPLRNASFRVLKKFPALLPRSSLDFLQPWRRGTGMASLDWNGDARADLLYVYGKKLYLFVGAKDGPQVYALDLSQVLSGLALIDVRFVRWKNAPVILLQQFPGNPLALFWKDNGFRMHRLPSAALSRALVAGEFSGKIRLAPVPWAGLHGGPNPSVQTSAIDFDHNTSRILAVDKISSPALSSHLFSQQGKTYLAFMRDFEGPSTIYDFHALLPAFSSLPLPILGHTFAQFHPHANSQLNIFVGAGFPGNAPIAARNPSPRPKKISDCVGEDSEACLLVLASQAAYPWHEFCDLLSPSIFIAICRMQFTPRPHPEIRLPAQFTWSSVAYSKLEPPIIDTEWTKAIQAADQLWHLQPVGSDLIAAEAGLDPKKPQRLLRFYSTGKNILTEDLGTRFPPGIEFDGYKFSIDSFAGGRKPALAFRSGQDFYFLDSARVRK